MEVEIEVIVVKAVVVLVLVDFGHGKVTTGLQWTIFLHFPYS